MSDFWFITTSKKLLDGSFKYPGRKRLLSTANSRIKILERTLLNTLKLQFEGYFIWEDISKDEHDSKISKKQNTLNVKVVTRLKKVLSKKKTRNKLYCF